MNLAGRLLAAARTHAGRPAVHAGSTTLTYAELFAGAEQVAEHLRAAGVGPGDRVALWMEKSIPSLRVLLGTLLAGAAYVPIDPRAPARRALSIAADAADCPPTSLPTAAAASLSEPTVWPMALPESTSPRTNAERCASAAA